MQVGISTASLFGRFVTEDALKFLSENNVPLVEVFLESYCEYDKSFGEILKNVKGQTTIHSVHTLTTQFEPQLYSVNERARTDSFKILRNVLSVAEQVGAKCYTFHGGARFKKTPLVLDLDRVGAITQEIINVCAEYGVKLAYENVHWGYYNYLGFYSELKKRTKGLCATLDVKQARQSGLNCFELIKEMGQDIQTLHLSDIDENGKMCLPGKGVLDLKSLFSALKDYGFDGAILLEVYKNDFSSFSELFSSMQYVKSVAEQVF